MTDYLLTALYDAKGPAESGRDDLAALGVPSDDIAIRSASAVADPAAPDPTWQEPGVAAVPEADRLIFDQGLRRGGYLLAARVGEDMLERAREVLEHLDPVDLAEHTPDAPGTFAAGDTDAEHATAPARTSVAPDGEPALAHPPAPDDPTRAGGFGESIAYAAEPGGHGTIRRRVRAFPM